MEMVADIFAGVVALIFAVAIGRAIIAFLGGLRTLFGIDR